MIEQEKMIVEALPSLYPLQKFEEDAVHAVIDALPHWIPVTERLPDNSRNVLITSRGGVSMAWYNGSYFEKGANTHHRKMQTVTAWCELPEPCGF